LQHKRNKKQEQSGVSEANMSQKQRDYAPKIIAITGGSITLLGLSTKG
jgi:hypothetical protein